MSNRYRQQEQQREQQTRTDRLIDARMIIEAQAALSPERSKDVHEMLTREYEERGGLEVDSQIEAMLLVIEEGKLYRKAALKHAADRETNIAVKAGFEPKALEKPPVSATTMVSASRQLERLLARRQAIMEDAELFVAVSLSVGAKVAEQKQARRSQPQTPAEAATPKAAPAPSTEAAATHGERAAAAAA